MLGDTVVEQLRSTTRDRINAETSEGSASRPLDRQHAFQHLAAGCSRGMKSSRDSALAGDPKAIHRMRIELTKLRAAVLFFSPMVDDAEWSRINDNLRWLNSALGKARDNDVTMTEAV
jgi:CHAD domain-containing protein